MCLPFGEIPLGSSGNERKVSWPSTLVVLVTERSELIEEMDIRRLQAEDKCSLVTCEVRMVRR